MKEKVKEATRQLLDEYYALTDSEVLLAANSTERLRIAAKIGEMKDVGLSHLPSGIAAEMQILERHLLAADDNNKTCSTNPLIVKPSCSTKRRRGYQVGHIPRSDLDKLMGSRLQLRCDPIQSNTLKSSGAKNNPITTFADLRIALDSAQFGCHPLLSDPPDIGIREIPPKAVKEKCCFSPTRHSTDTATGGADPPRAHSSSSALLFDISKIKELVSVGPNDFQRESVEDNHQRQRINLGNLVVDEEQLKIDIRRDLPNVWGVEIQYENNNGIVDAILSFSYVPTVRESSTTVIKKKSSGERELPATPTEKPPVSICSGNVGKEQRPLSTKTNSSDGLPIESQSHVSRGHQASSPRKPVLFGGNTVVELVC